MTGPALRFVCVDDGVPEETTRLLHAACEARGVGWLHLEAREFTYDARLQPGDLLYRPAVSLAAQRVEAFLWEEEIVASFYPPGASPFTECVHPLEAFERAGLAVPRTFPLHTTDRAVVRGFVEQLGGFPVVLKAPGGEGGVGVLRADSFPALFSLVDFTVSKGDAPLLSAYVEGAVHHRVVVVGERAVATYRNPTREDDFRSMGPDDPALYAADVPARLAKVGVRAAQAIGRELAGVDVLEHPSGRLYVLEANFPCFHPQAELVAGIPVSGAMVDHLAAKARALAASSSAQAG